MDSTQMTSKLVRSVWRLWPEKKFVLIRVPLQVWYDSKDGTKVPMFIVRHRSTVFDGTAPAIQYGNVLFPAPCERLAYACGIRYRLWRILYLHRPILQCKLAYVGPKVWFYSGGA